MVFNRRCVLCNTSTAENPNLVLHRFPKPGPDNFQRMVAWAQFCYPNEDYSSMEFLKKLYSSHKMLCDKHFPKSAFVENHLHQMKLHRYAIPSENSSTTRAEVPTGTNSAEPSQTAISTFSCMADINPEIKTYFGKCKCCLNYGYLRTMWEKHINEEDSENSEIYGRMLTECFAIPWTIETTEEDDQICENCIWRLREAYLFKKQVLQCQKKLEQCALGDVDLEMKLELDNEDNFIVEYLEEDDQDSFEEEKCDSVKGEGSDAETVKKESQDGKESRDGKESQNGKESRDGKESQDDASQNEDYEELEELDPEDKDSRSVTEALVPRKRRARRPVSSDIDNKSKWPKKLPKEERYKTYKQYTEDDLKSAMDAVTIGEMSQSDAADHYQVPRKTLAAKLRDAKKNKPVFPLKSGCQFVREVEILLNHVNATPFRCQANNPLCFYCPDKVRFSSPEDLRSHNKNQHSNPTRKVLEVVMRPLFHNEIVKLDLKDISCKICDIALLNWADTLQHLESVHDVTLECKNKMIPFILDDNSCVLCSQEFSSFMLLHAHMNKHYNNFICGVCGDSFVSSSRLKTHQKIHEIGVFPCPVCSKVFTLEKYMKKHVVIHTDEMRIKCHHCGMMFKTENQRQAHKFVSHKEHVESITCELCGTIFHWMRHFLIHMQRKHKREYHCEQCGKFFHSRADLKVHLKFRHVGAKEFKCLVCCKKFFARASLRSHIKCSHQNIKV